MYAMFSKNPNIYNTFVSVQLCANFLNKIIQTMNPADVVSKSHDVRAIFVIFQRLHLFCHSKDILKSCTETGHMLKIGLFFHLDSQIVNSSIFKNCRHLNRIKILTFNLWQMLRLQTRQFCWKYDRR